MLTEEPGGEAQEVIDPSEEATARLPVEANPDDMTPSERANLAASMSPEMRKVIGSRVVERFRRDLSSRADRMKKLDQLQKMYALTAEAKSFPWHKCANVKTPALTGPNLQIQARLYDMIWPANGKIFSVVPATSQDQQFAHMTEQFANSYVRYCMPYMAQGLDDTLHQMTLYGSAFRRTYWDAYERKVRSDWVPLEDFVVAAKTRSQDPSMSDVPRYTYVQHMSAYDIEARGLDGIFIDAELAVGVAADGTGDESEFTATAKKIDGAEMESDDEDMPRKVLEQHCRWRLPSSGKHPSFDGKEHYVIITVDLTTSTVLRMTLREEDDPDDKRRFDRETERFEQYQSELKAYEEQQAMAALAPAQDMTAPSMAMDPPDMTMPGIDPMMGPPPPMPGDMRMVAPPPAPLELPEPVNPPRAVRRRQICLFTHYRCFPSDGFYALGYGDLLYGIALAQNTVINQWVDGQAVKNARPMFMSRQLRMQRGSIDIGPAAVNEVDAPMGSIKDAITFLDPPGSDPGTVPLIKMLDSMRDQIAGNGDLMSGQAPGSNQTKAGMQILNDQMMAPITVLARRVKEAFKHELSKMWRCWGVFLEDEDFVDVIGEGGQPQQMQIGKAMFSPSAHLVPTSDPRMKSQRLEDLKGLVSFVMSMPNIIQNPAVGGPVLGKLCEMVLRAFPDGEALVPLLTPPLPPPPEPKDQTEENAGFLEGKDSPVLPPDDDNDHIAKIEMFQQTPEFGALDPKGQQAVMQHLRGHLAQRMKKGMQFGQGQIPPGGPGGNGPGVMAGPGPVAPPPGPPPQ